MGQRVAPDRAAQAAGPVRRRRRPSSPPASPQVARLRGRNTCSRSASTATSTARRGVGRPGRSSWTADLTGDRPVSARAGFPAATPPGGGTTQCSPGAGWHPLPTRVLPRRATGEPETIVAMTAFPAPRAPRVARSRAHESENVHAFRPHDRHFSLLGRDPVPTATCTTAKMKVRLYFEATRAAFPDSSQESRADYPTPTTSVIVEFENSEVDAPGFPARAPANWKSVPMPHARSGPVRGSITVCSASSSICSRSAGSSARGFARLGPSPRAGTNLLPSSGKERLSTRRSWGMTVKPLTGHSTGDTTANIQRTVALPARVSVMGRGASAARRKLTVSSYEKDDLTLQHDGARAPWRPWCQKPTSATCKDCEQGLRQALVSTSMSGSPGAAAAAATALA